MILPTNHNTPLLCTPKTGPDSLAQHDLEEGCALHSMTSPPRRMTRARAKQEGFEPDWRINPHWKTPRKPTAKSLRIALPADDTKNDTRSVISRGAQRIPSPTKIRPPIQRPPESLPSGTAACPEPHEALHKSVLGSPIRVHPRTDHMRTPAIDKENSPLATLSTWSSPKKAGVPNTPSISSPSRPLKASPTTSNIQPHSTSVKILSTPIRVLNPHTPGRHLGSARRIPIKLDKANPRSLNLHPIADLPDPQPLHDSTYPTSQCPPRSNRTTASIMRKPTSPLKLHQNRELEFIDPIPKPVRISQASSVLAPALPTSPQQSPDSTHWTPLKPIPPLQRKMSSSTNPPQLRPSKGLQQRPPSLQVTKKDFYVDESFSSPLRTNSGSIHRSTSQVPKFPIRRRSIAQPTPLTDGSLPSKALSNEIHLHAIKEFNPTKKVGKWKPPVKASASAEIPRVHNDIRTRVMSPASTNSTTPNGTPQPRSPKVFDLSDSEEAGPHLFTPKKPKPTSHSLLHTAKIVNPSDTALLEIPNIQVTDKVHVPCSTATPMQTSTSRTSSDCANDSPQVFEGMPEYQRDITVPIKDACLGNLTTEINPSSALLSETSHCVDKRSTKPLQGVVAYVDVRTADGDDAGAPFADALRTLGAKVVRHWTWNGEEAERMALTHVIFKEGGPRTLSKVKMAKGAVKCVGLGWISRYK